MIPLWFKILGPVALLIAVIGGAKLYIAHIDRTARAEQKAADEAAVKEARAQAKVNDLETTRKVEAARAQGTKEANDALLPQLESARAGLADYARRLRNQAAQGRSGGADLPGASDSPNVADGTDQVPLLDDLDRCTEAVVRLKNVQDWWKGIEK